MFHSSLNIMDTIRYEYAEESSNSSGSADPALFKREPNSLEFDDRYSSPSFDYHLDSLAGYSGHISRMQSHDNDFSWSHEDQVYSPLVAKLGLSTTTDNLLTPLSAYNLPPASSGVLSSLDNTTNHPDAYIHSPSTYTPHQHSYEEEDSFDVSGFVQECLTDEGYRRVIVDSSSGYAEYKYEEEDDFGFDENTPVETFKGGQVAATSRGGGGGPVRNRPVANRSVGCEGKAGEPEQQQMAGGFYKPMYSFSCLIGLALKNSSSGELTVSEIYAFLCEHFPYFRAAPSGWKNSVRHNLSLNKCFQKIEVETPGCHGRKSCLWRLNPHRETKMDHELRKARERNEPLILKAMTNPEDLDSIQAGTKGMPSTVRRRIVVPIEETTYVMKTAPPKIIRRTPYTTQANTSQRLSTSSSSSFISSTNQSGKLSSGESVREAAARKLDYLLQQKSAITYSPDMEEELSPPIQKRSSGGNAHSLKNEDFVDNSTPSRRSNNSNGQSSSKGPQRSPLQSSYNHNHQISSPFAKRQKEVVEGDRVNCRDNSAHTDYYSRHNFHNYQQPPAPTSRQPLQRAKPTTSQGQRSSKAVESMAWMGADRSLSPLSYSSCSYDIVTEAIHNNILLDSAMTTSPCKRLL